MLSLGPVVGTGARSTVYECGPRQVVKVPLPSTPDAWIRYEAEFTSVVHRYGLPVPAVHDLVVHDGRLCVLYERIEGPSMWAVMRSRPGMASEQGRVLAELHLAVLATPAPIVLPRQRDRLAGKIHRAARARDESLLGALAALPSTDGPLRLCHGDLHPGNVIVSPHGPVILDWFDSSRGVPIGDVARSALLMGAGGVADRVVPHLPGAEPPLLRDAHDSYLSAIVAGLGPLDRFEFDRWLGVEAVARLAEGLPSSGLLDVWRSSPGAHAVVDRSSQGGEERRR